MPGVLLTRQGPLTRKNSQKTNWRYMAFGEFGSAVSWFLARESEAGKIKLLSLCMPNGQFCGFPRGDAAGNFTDGIKSAALQ